ncbi:calcium uniporter protein, mitochondrial isoform X1 [Diaphorina citri]|uniref:Calcium uniporter protein n=1 Tax=Diaphorina citri TaxID=121845 RepID=A0A1S3D4I7_DIACI|nr:calcium uniporter protein, mitochondrial isoform X2 [Diaphorina citri]XP_008474251.1 calcium uniporter protein, mitochondrial isoform X1 [Diaphorina citri]
MAACASLIRSRIFLVVDINRIFNYCSFSICKNNNYSSFSPLQNSPQPFLSVITRQNPIRYNGTLSDDEDIDVRLEYKKGLPHITVPLPSRREKCCFILRPITHTVGDFLQMLRTEDKGIDRVIIKTKDKVKIASSNSIQSLLDDDFILIVNDVEFLVKAPLDEKLFKDDLERLSEVRHLISHLYEALNVGEHHVQQEKELKAQLETIKSKLEPLEKQKYALELNSTRHTNVLKWVGLGLMSVQFGILARLTWWEYSWDIMEPVTYFVTYGTAMGTYAYYVLTKQEYYLPDVRDRQFLIHLHKRAKKVGFPLEQYNCLKNECGKLENDLARLRDPLIPPYRGYEFQVPSDLSYKQPSSSINKFKEQIKMILSKQSHGANKNDTS